MEVTIKMFGGPGPIRRLTTFPADRAQAARAAGWDGKIEITDYAYFCRELEAFLRNGRPNFFFYCKMKVNKQGGFFLDLKGEAVPVFSLWALQNFVGKEIFVSAEVREGSRFLTLSADGRTSFTVRAYNYEFNRFCFRRQGEPEESVTYVLAVGPNNEARFLGYTLLFNFEWKPGNMVLARVKDDKLVGFVCRERRGQFPVTAVAVEGKPKMLLVGNPITDAMLAKVSGVLEKDLHVLPNRGYGNYVFYVGNTPYYLTPADFEGVPDAPTQAKIRVELDQGKVIAVEIRRKHTKKRIEFVVARDEKGVVRKVSSSRIYHRPKGNTHIVTGFASQVVDGEEQINFFGVKAALRTLGPESAETFVPPRYSFLVHKGEIIDPQRASTLLPTRFNLLKLRTFLLTEWQGRVIPADSFYQGLLAAESTRNVAEEHTWHVRYLGRKVEFLNGRASSLLSAFNYKQAAAFMFVLAEILGGKTSASAKERELFAQQATFLLATLGAEKFSQAAAWLWAFAETQSVVPALLPYLDIRDQEHGEVIRGAFDYDPFLWNRIFQQKMSP